MRQEQFIRLHTYRGCYKFLLSILLTVSGLNNMTTEFVKYFGFVFQLLFSLIKYVIWVFQNLTTLQFRKLKHFRNFHVTLPSFNAWCLCSKSRSQWFASNIWQSSIISNIRIACHYGKFNITDFGKCLSIFHASKTAVSHSWVRAMGKARGKY